MHLFDRVGEDCAIVAAYELSVAINKPKTYDQVRRIAIKRGWWTPNNGFNTKYTCEFFKAIGANGDIVEAGTPTKVLREKVKSGKPIVLIVERSDMPMSHAVLGVKGTKGVRLINADPEYPGWKSVCKAMKKGKIKVYAWSAK